MIRKFYVFIFVCLIIISFCSCSYSEGKIMAQGNTPGITDYHNRGDIFADVPAGAAFVDISTGGLNVRSEPTTKTNNFIAYLYPNEIIEITEPNNPVGWHRVKLNNGKEGYCKADFLSSIAGKDLSEINTIYNPGSESGSTPVPVKIKGAQYYIVCSINPVEKSVASGFYKPVLLLLDESKKVLSLIPTGLFSDYVWLEDAAEADLNGDGTDDIVLLWGCNTYRPSAAFGLDICVGLPDGGYRNLGGLYEFNGDISLVEFIYYYNPLSDEFLNFTIDYLRENLKYGSFMYEQ